MGVKIWIARAWLTFKLTATLGRSSGVTVDNSIETSAQGQQWQNQCANDHSGQLPRFLELWSQNRIHSTNLINLEVTYLVWRSYWSSFCTQQRETNLWRMIHLAKIHLKWVELSALSRCHPCHGCRKANQLLYTRGIAFK